MPVSRALVRHALVWVACVCSLSAGAADSAGTVPASLRPFAERGVVVGLDTAAAQPRLIVGDRFKVLARGRQLQLKQIARQQVRDARPDASMLVVVDTSGKVLETVAIRH